MDRRGILASWSFAAGCNHSSSKLCPVTEQWADEAGPELSCWWLFWECSVPSGKSAWRQTYPASFLYTEWMWSESFTREGKTSANSLFLKYSSKYMVEHCWMNEIWSHIKINFFNRDVSVIYGASKWTFFKLMKNRCYRSKCLILHLTSSFFNFQITFSVILLSCLL